MSTSGIHVGIHGEQLPNALQRHYLLFATLATQRPSGPCLARARSLLLPPTFGASLTFCVSRRDRLINVN